MNERDVYACVSRCSRQTRLLSIYLKPQFMSVECRFTTSCEGREQGGELKRILSPYPVMSASCLYWEMWVFRSR